MQQSIQDQIHIQPTPRNYTNQRGWNRILQDLEVVVYSNQRDGDETKCRKWDAYRNKVGQEGNNTGRVDYPLAPEAAKKLAEEAHFGEINFVLMVQDLKMQQLQFIPANGG